MKYIVRYHMGGELVIKRNVESDQSLKSIMDNYGYTNQSHMQFEDSKGYLVKFRMVDVKYVSVKELHTT